MAVLIGAALYAVGKFVKDHERIPTKKERARLALASLGTSTLVSLVLVGIFLSIFGGTGLLIEVFSEIHPGIIIAIFVVTLGLYAALLWLIYGWFAKIQLRTLERKKISKD